MGLKILREKAPEGVGIKTFDVPIGEGSICKSKELKDSKTKNYLFFYYIVVSYSNS